MNAWRWYWLLWLTVGFVVPETIALVRDPRNTLSYAVWSWFGVKAGVPISHWTFLHFLLLLLLIWLIGHFAFGIWR